MAGIFDYPRTRTEFDAMFATEQDGNDYLARLRWPDSYRCPDCGNREWWLTARRYTCCTKCRRQEGLKSGTMFQDSAVSHENVVRGLLAHLRAEERH